MKFKADFHMHTNDDPVDTKMVKHSNKDLIDHAAKLGFEVLSITNHDKITFNSELKEYAQVRGILLIPGVEATIEGKHVLLINYEGLLPFKKVEDLAGLKGSHTLVIAAHPFFPGPLTLQHRLIKHLHLFDAIEHCHFYRPWINFNKKAVQLAKEHKKPMCGTSDAHFLVQMGYTYSMVEAEEKTPEAIVAAIKKGQVSVVTQALPWHVMLPIGIKMFVL